MDRRTANGETNKRKIRGEHTLNKDLWRESEEKMWNAGTQKEGLKTHRQRERTRGNGMEKLDKKGTEQEREGKRKL